MASAAGVILAACGTPDAGSDSPGAATPPGGTLTFMTWSGAPERMTAYTAMARALETALPRYKVEVVPPGSGNYFDRLISQTAGGDALDVVGAGSPVWVAPLAARGIYADLGPRVTRDKSFKAGDYAGGIVDAGTYRGKLYAINLSVAAGVLYYNKDAFDRQGSSYPDASWDWMRLQDAAGKLTRRQGETTEQFGFTALDDLLGMLYWIWNNGGEVFDRAEDPTRSTMTNPATVQAVQLATDMRARQRVMPQATDRGFAFESGNVAMGLLNIGSLAAVTAAAQHKWDVAPRPMGPRGNVDRLGGEIYGVCTTSRLPDGAWELWKTVIGPVGGKEWMALNNAPVLKPLYPPFEALAPPPTRKIVTSAMNGLRPIPKTMKALDVYTAVYTNLFRAAFTGQKSVMQVCQEIDQQVNALLSAP